MTGMVLGPEKWWTIATALRDAVAAVLDPAICRAVVMPGNIAWDDCECGLLAVTIARTFLSDVFPEPQAEPVGIGCDAVYEVSEFLLDVVRCAPSPVETGQGDIAPAVEALEAAAQQMSQDAVDTLNAVSTLLCRMKNDLPEEIVDFLIGQQTAAGPEGGCVGTELHVMVSLRRG